MSDFELQLSGENACINPKGDYFSRMYWLLPNKQVRTCQVDIKKISSSNPKKVIWDSMLALEKKIGGKVTTESLVAVAGLRVCRNTRHNDGRITPDQNVVLERVCSLVIVRSLDIALETIRSCTPPNAAGVGSAMRAEPRKQVTMVPVQQLIHLPVTPTEKLLPIDKAIWTAPGTGRATDPYVLLHGKFGEPDQVEQLVLQGDLW